MPEVKTLQRPSLDARKRGFCKTFLQHIHSSKTCQSQYSILKRIWILNLKHPSRRVFLGKGVLKICIKYTAKHPCWRVISIKLQSNFIEITLQHGCSPVNFLHIFRTLSYKSTSGKMFVKITSGETF